VAKEGKCQSAVYFQKSIENNPRWKVNSAKVPIIPETPLKQFMIL